jgi:TolB protein
MRDILSVSLALLAIAAVPAARAQGGVIEGGDITERLAANVIPVRVEASAPELQRLATQAFSAHGAFRVETSSSAGYTLRFAVNGPNGVRLTIESGRPARVIFTQDATGGSLRAALLRAADAAVTHLARLPGIFSGRLAFVSERTGSSEIYTSDLFFSEVTQLTHDRSQTLMPRWAPDGRRILYTGYFQSGFPDIYLIDTSNNQRVPFVSVKGTNTGARFSPDGRQVAMILSGEGNPELYISNAQGRGIRRLTRTERQIEATPSWAPDGTRLVVASDAQATGKPQLYLIGTGGGALQRLPTNISGYCAEPDWNHKNPDLVAFTIASGGGFQVAVYSFSQRTSRQVGRVPGDGIEPCWTADGRHLLVTSRTASSQRVYLIDTETGRATPLSPTSLGKAYQANYIAR